MSVYVPLYCIMEKNSRTRFLLFALCFRSVSVQCTVHNLHNIPLISCINFAMNFKLDAGTVRYSYFYLFRLFIQNLFANDSPSLDNRILKVLGTFPYISNSINLVALEREFPKHNPKKKNSCIRLDCIDYGRVYLCVCDVYIRMLFIENLLRLCVRTIQI